MQHVKEFGLGDSCHRLVWHRKNLLLYFVTIMVLCIMGRMLRQ